MKKDIDRIKVMDKVILIVMKQWPVGEYNNNCRGRLLNYNKSERINQLAVKILLASFNIKCW